MASITQQLAAVKRSAASKAKAETERIGTASPGDTVRQGDLYLVCLPALPSCEPAKSRQLAPGTTQGSRHVAEGECLVFMPRDTAAVAAQISGLVRGAVVPAQLIGPLVECNGEVTISHPEHGWRILPAGTTWATVYQRQFAEEVRRVQD